MHVYVKDVCGGVCMYYTGCGAGMTDYAQMTRREKWLVNHICDWCDMSLPPVCRAAKWWAGDVWTEICLKPDVVQMSMSIDCWGSFLGVGTLCWCCDASLFWLLQERSGVTVTRPTVWLRVTCASRSLTPASRASWIPKAPNLLCRTAVTRLRWTEEEEEECAEPRLPTTPCTALQHSSAVTRTCAITEAHRISPTAGEKTWVRDQSREHPHLRLI